MRGTSGVSLLRGSERWEPVLRDAGPEALDLGEQLFGVVAALDGSARLRRALTDPARLDADKSTLARTVFARADERVTELLAALAGDRWTHERDLGNAVDVLGVDAVLASAENRGVLEQVENELFEFSRVLKSSGEAREAREALSTRSAAPERRRGLVDALLQGRADPATSALARHATVALRGRRFLSSIAAYGDRAAERRRRLVATITSAMPLNERQLDRLGTLLERAYGRGVQMNVTVDEIVVGGLRVQVGADVVDSTVLSRLADARRRLAS